MFGDVFGCQLLGLAQMCQRKKNLWRWDARTSPELPAAVFASTLDQEPAEMAHPGFAASDIDTSRPHPAPMDNYSLGGKTNYLLGQEAAREALRQAPELRLIAQEYRASLH